MATEYTQKGGSALPVAFKRSNPRPIDDDYIQLTAAQAVAFAASGTAYAGQIINIRAAGTVSNVTYRAGLYEIQANGTLRGIAYLSEVESIVSSAIAAQHIDTIGFQGAFNHESSILKDGFRAGSEYVVTEAMIGTSQTVSVGDYIVAKETVAEGEIDSEIQELIDEEKAFEEWSEAEIDLLLAHFVVLQQNLDDTEVYVQVNESIVAGTLSKVPKGDIAVYLNGVLQTPGTDYTVSGQTVTRLAAMGYASGDELRAVYIGIQTS